MILKSSWNQTLERPGNHLSSNINPTFGLKSKWGPIPENPKIRLQIPENGIKSQNQAQIPQAGVIHTEDSNQDNQLTRDIHDLKIKLKQDSREVEQPPKQ